MSLAARASLAAAGLTALVVVTFGSLAYGLFVRQQGRELRRLLEADLARIAALLDRPVLGASFVAPDAGGGVVQVVDEDGRPVLAWGPGADAPLPSSDEPVVREIGGRRYLVSSTSWREAGGTIRVAHGLEEAMASRGRLAGSLAVGGALTFLVASLLASAGARRALRPLEDVAYQARRVDPSEPAPIAYAGRSQEIASLADALNTTLAAIRERKDREREVLLEIAHELAGPLTLVDYHLSSLRDRPDDVTRLDAAAGAARELLRTSQDLLSLARGELERPLSPSVLSLRELIERVAAEYPGLRVAADGAGEAVGDPDRLIQVLRNLVRNGVQATGESRNVIVELRSGIERHEILVRDRGPGLGEVDANRVFERGYRRGGGSGVGLTICKTLVEQHDGTIEVAATGPSGTTFVVRLPSLASKLAPTGLEATTGES